MIIYKEEANRVTVPSGVISSCLHLLTKAAQLALAFGHISAVGARLGSNKCAMGK